MQKKKSPRALLIGLFLLMASTFLVASTIPRQKEFMSVGQDQTEESRLPVANFDATEPVDPEEKAKRRARSKHYNRQNSRPISEAPYSFERISSTYWWKDLPSIPVLQSDVILVGEVVDANAHLSEDKTGVYSEFSIRPEKVLKDSDVRIAICIANSQLILAERFGGAVRFPSGIIQKYRTQGQGMPRSGRRYLLFLKKLDQDQGFSVVTGYELRGEKVIPIDGGKEEGTERLPFDSYRGANVSSFLRLVQDAIKPATPDLGQ